MQSKSISNLTGLESWMTWWQSFLPKAIRFLIGLAALTAFWQWRHTFHFAQVHGEYFEYGSWHVYLADVFALGAVVLGGIASSLRRPTHVPRQVWWSGTAVLAWMTLSSLWAVDHVVALIDAGEFWLWAAFATVLVNRAEDMKGVWRWLGLGAALSAFVGVGQYLTNHSLGLWRFGESVLDPAKSGVIVVLHNGVRWLRAAGLTPHPNIFGGTLLLVWAWVMAWLNKKSLWWLLSLILICGIGLSFARASWICFVALAAISMMVAAARQNRARVTILGLSLGVFALVLGANWDAVTHRVQISGDTLEERSISERIGSVAEWKEMVLDHLWLGVGAGNYTIMLSREYPNSDVWDLRPVHNVSLLRVSETGVAGAFLAAIVWAIILWYTISRRVPWDKVAPVLAWVGLGLVDHWPLSLHQGYVGLFFALALLFWPRKV